MAETLPAYAELFGQPEQLWTLSKSQKKLLLYGTFGGAGLYFLYKAYKSDTLQALIELRGQLQDGLEGFGESFKVSSKVSQTVMSDLHHFLNSDEDQIPQSLRQLSKLARSEEITDLTSRLANAAAKGFMSAASPSNRQDGDASSSPDFLSQILDALSTEKGSNLVSLAVSMACKSCVQAYCEFGGSSGVSGPNFWQQLLEYGTTTRGEKLYSCCVGSFAREGVKVYMGSLEGTSGWDDLLNNLCKPERALAIDRMTRSFVNELVVSYFKKTRYGLRQEWRSGKSASGKQDKMGLPVMSANALSNVEEKIRRFSANETAVGESAMAAPLAAQDWTEAIVQISKRSEVRSLVLSIAKTATGEGIRTSMLTAKDLLLDSFVTSHDLQKLSSRNLGTLILMVFMPILIFLAGRRSGLA